MVFSSFFCVNLPGPSWRGGASLPPLCLGSDGLPTPSHPPPPYFLTRRHGILFKLFPNPQDLLPVPCWALVPPRWKRPGATVIASPSVPHPTCMLLVPSRGGRSLFFFPGGMFFSSLLVPSPLPTCPFVPGWNVPPPSPKIPYSIWRPTLAGDHGWISFFPW